MPRRKRSQPSTSSEHSATSENMNLSDELPDIVLETKNPDFRKDRRNFRLVLAEESEKETVDLTAGFTCGSTTQSKANSELMEVDLTEDDKLPKTAATKATKQTTKKKDAAAEREAKKQLKDDEKRSKMESEEINKMYKPGECLKHLQLEMHPQLSKLRFMEDVKREVKALGVRVVETPELELGALLWVRDEPRQLVTDGGQVKLSNVFIECGHKMHIIQAKEAYTGKRWEQEIARGTVVLFGMQDFVKKSRSAKHASNKGVFSRSVNNLQIDLMLKANMQLVLVESSIELGLLVARYTRAIADAPFKQAKREIDEQAGFYMRGDNKNCVTVDKDGNGLSRLWEQMIAVLPLSSLEVARSLGAAYKSPRGLSTELQSSGGMSRIADIGVSRTNVPGSKTRRLGPEFSRKLHVLFTSEDGDQLIE